MNRATIIQQIVAYQCVDTGRRGWHGNPHDTEAPQPRLRSGSPIQTSIGARSTFRSIAWWERAALLISVTRWNLRGTVGLVTPTGKGRHSNRFCRRLGISKAYESCSG
jgi:hypothetical protein